MSFRCPKCKLDFGFDEKRLSEHLEENDDCRKEAVFLYADRSLKLKNHEEEDALDNNEVQNGDN